VGARSIQKARIKTILNRRKQEDGCWSTRGARGPRGQTGGVIDRRSAAAAIGVSLNPRFARIGAVALPSASSDKQGANGTRLQTTEHGVAAGDSMK